MVCCRDVDMLMYEYCKGLHDEAKFCFGREQCGIDNTASGASVLMG